MKANQSALNQFKGNNVYNSPEMSNTQQKGIFTAGTGLKWMPPSHPASHDKNDSIWLLSRPMRAFHANGENGCGSRTDPFTVGKNAVPKSVGDDVRSLILKNQQFTIASPKLK
jgi:hypothetical protein